MTLITSTTQTVITIPYVLDAEKLFKYFSNYVIEDGKTIITDSGPYTSIAYRRIKDIVYEMKRDEKYAADIKFLNKLNSELSQIINRLD